MDEKKKDENSKGHGNIHDQAFKRFFNDNRKITGLLKKVLPADIFDKFDWHTLVKMDSAMFSKHNLRERYGDIIVSVKLKGGRTITIYVILEHKAQKDGNALVQVMDYCACLIQSNPNSGILPIILTCCEDKNYEMPTNYTEWVLRKKGLTDEEREFFKLPSLPTIFSCLVYNLRELPEDIFENDEEYQDVAFLMKGLSWFWEIDEENEELVLEILDILRGFTYEEQLILLPLLIDYYESGDRIRGRSVDRIDRKRNKGVPEKERTVTIIEWTVDKPKKAYLKGIEQGIEQGIERGREEGIERGREEGREEGIEKGIERGREEGIEKGIVRTRRETATKLLKMGAERAFIIEATDLTEDELLALIEELED